MKRLSSADSVGALMSSICPISTDDDQGNMMLEGMDEEGCSIEELGHVSEKKRRLSVDQVRALEKNFEVENKLEPERKVKLAQELGLQPRQVAVWFQNRRARWKTKQLERDYTALKANHDVLLQKFQALQRDNQSLLSEIEELKSKLSVDGKPAGSKVAAVKEETKLDTPDADLINFHNNKNDFRDGSSDSDSSAILNEDSPIAAAAAAAAISSTGGILHHSPYHFLNMNFNASEENVLEDSQKAYEPQFVKIEEHNFFGDETNCSGLFSDEQAPTLSWCGCSDEWD